MTESPSADAVFVDPTGRRRSTVRIVGIASAAVLAGYLLLVFLAAFGAPLPPAARLPLPADLGTGSAGDRPVVQVVEPQPSSDPALSTTDDTGQPGPSTPAGPTASAANPAQGSTTRGSRPTAPPGQGKQPTPPGQG